MDLLGEAEDEPRDVLEAPGRVRLRVGLDDSESEQFRLQLIASGVVLLVLGGFAIGTSRCMARAES